jgi:hypothetical protein
VVRCCAGFAYLRSFWAAGLWESEYVRDMLDQSLERCVERFDVKTIV